VNSRTAQPVDATAHDAVTGVSGWARLLVGALVAAMAVSESGADEEAEAFLAYLQGPEASAAFARQGFDILGP